MITRTNTKQEAQLRPVRLTFRKKLQNEMQKHAVAVCRELGLDAYARMDFLLNDKIEMFCLEANTLPGMTATSLLPQEAAVIGIQYEDLCERLIQISQEKVRRKA